MTLHHQLMRAQGQGESARELLVLGPALGTTLRCWVPASRSLLAHPSGVLPDLLTYDLPGHGESPPAREPFSIADLGSAVVEAARSRGYSRFAYAGISVGGAIGLELAAACSPALTGLALFGSDAVLGSPDRWNARAASVRELGMLSQVETSAARWFAPDFALRQKKSFVVSLAELSRIDPESYALCLEAVAVYDVRADLAGIAVPTTIVCGSADIVTLPAELRTLALTIPGARYQEIPGAGHVVPLESPEPTASVLRLLLGEIRTRARAIPGGSPADGELRVHRGERC
ncbi:alpha/beta fold hydrolase [Herbiconiux sp. CPCC 203407]|uniref:Alpha/beta fold hydrolase n=1 Tax=Herbiconiux oxytropis TaxID=2970915 RepID=A0AA42BTQ5_9MICO|nr:alpha/beta fold hydrolase [Herbiconiux oxytropis]MCS5721693.1 alpha/beta fold hydrolase [Herbiconiux oxytropis]MCS5726680.1 alpha/beta fold hydrolase [Herbiconiux oxytropis]